MITSPLEWQLTAAPLPPMPYPIAAERGGTQLHTPRPVILVDTREKNPFSFHRFGHWFSGIQKTALETGDYSIAGLEQVCAVERKDLPDLVQSLTTNRRVFVERLRRMSCHRHRLLVITAALSQVKSRYPFSDASPNRITQSLVAALAGLAVPFLCVETHELGEEIVASYLYQVFLYTWLESNDHGCYLVEDDL